MKIVSTNPSRNYEVIGEVEISSEQDVKNAVAKARKVQPAWAALSQIDRNRAIESFIEVCKQHSQEIAEIVTQEMGKPITQSHAQVKESLNYFQAYMDMAE